MTDVFFPAESIANQMIWNRNFSDTLQNSGEAYFVDAATVTTVTTAMTALEAINAKADALATRTLPVVRERRAQLDSFHKLVSPIVSQIQRDDRVSVELRNAVGIRTLGQARTPAPMPTQPPSVELAATGPRSVRVIVRDPASPDRRAKPAGVRQVQVRVHLGDEPTRMPVAWEQLHIFGKTDIDLFFNDLVRPTGVWVSCAWVSTRNAVGPYSSPIHVAVTGMGNIHAAEGDVVPLKIAA